MISFKKMVWAFWNHILIGNLHYERCYRVGQVVTYKNGQKRCQYKST